MKQTKRKTDQEMLVLIENTERFTPNTVNGLTQEQVALRNRQGLSNRVEKQYGKSYSAIFLKNIFSFFNILVFSIAILLIIAKSYDNLFFAVIALLNTTIGIVQEIRAKVSIQKLKLVTAPRAQVLRDGKFLSLSVEDVVLDDTIKLSLGKQVASDCIVVEGEVEANEALITGESVPIKKQKGDIVYSGSFVVSGSALAIVEHVGAANYVEMLSSKAKTYKKPKSQLMNSINWLIKGIGVILVPLGIITFYNSFIGLESFWDAVKAAAASVIGMIPSGMMLLTSTALALSVVKLARNKALVQDLYSTEMLARVDVLCLDKTGTITDGTMRLQEVIEIDQVKGYHIGTLLSWLSGSTMDNNQTARALTDAYGASKSEFRELVVQPFSSARKYSAASYDRFGTLAVGAPEFVMPNLSDAIMSKAIEYQRKGYRVLLLAYGEGLMAQEGNPALPEDIRPLALLIIEDRIRDDAVQTIKWFKDNQVATKVISGDNPMTVSVIAKRVGIPDAENFISLDGLSNQEVISAANKYTVFGRVTPDQKALLIKSMRRQGHTVAMTGDGVNDILAMKEADCSVAIAAGSEAARSVANLVLMDSKFSSMPKVVEEGRKVVNNIQNSSSLYLMKTLFTFMLTVFLLIMGEPYLFEPKHLTVLEICVIGIASFCLAFQPNKKLIEGNFLVNTAKMAIPSGIALFCSVAGWFFLDRYVYSISNEQMVTLAMFSLTYSGLVALMHICMPFTKISTITFLTVAALVTGVFMLVPNTFFELVPLAGMPVTLIIYMLFLILLSNTIIMITKDIVRHFKFNILRDRAEKNI
ncbi:MAG: HAD-IC family P-type ATPase [Clostridia bacterium]|nr:HAD-IC family P-type ATPase [Clostridia bacterium]